MAAAAWVAAGELAAGAAAAACFGAAGSLAAAVACVADGAAAGLLAAGGAACFAAGRAASLAVPAATLIGAAPAPLALPMPDPDALVTGLCSASAVSAWLACDWPPPTNAKTAAVPAARLAATAAAGTTLPARLRAALNRECACRPV